MMIMKKILCNIILVLVSFCLCHELEAQENSLERYHVVKDISHSSVAPSYLSSNIVTTIEQDKNGMLWFGTKRGLNSFDSYSFEEYSNKDGIINATITNIRAVDETLFIGTVKGLSVYNIKERNCVNYFAEIDSLVLPHNCICYISQPVNDKIVICTKGGTSVYNLITKEFVIPKVENYKPEYEINYVEYMAHDDSWWVATSNGLIKYNHVNQSIMHFYHVKDVQSTIPDNFLNCFCVKDSINIFIGTQNGLCLLNTQNNEIKRIDLNELANYQSNNIDISKIIRFSDEEIMISTRGDGIFLYNYVDETVMLISKMNRRYTISENVVFDIYKDSNGTVWIATFTGLNKLEKKLSNFFTVQHFEDRTLLAVTYFHEMPNGNILFGTESGIKIFNIDDVSVTDFSDYYGLENTILDSLYIYSLYYDDTDTSLWVGTRSDGLYKFSFEKNTIVEISRKYDANKLKHAIVREIVRDDNDNLWLTTNIGLCCLNVRTEDVKFFLNNPKESHSLPNNDTYDLILADTVLYVTTGDGLALYNFERDEFKTYRIPDSLTKDNVVKNNGLYDIVLGGDGRWYYIGSYSCGLVAFNPVTKEIKTAVPKGRFSSSIVYSVIPDDKGNLWASTNKGITKYNLYNRETTVYDISDGLQGNEFTPNAFLDYSGGFIFFGGFNGFTYFDPDEIYLETTKPQVVVTSLKTNNDKLYRYITDGDTIRLTYKDNSIEIGFATLNLLRKNMVTFSYILDGYDEDWLTYNYNHPYAEYHRLRPGTYTFKLKASNELNVWNDKPLCVTIIIKPAWYQTLMFKLSLILIIIVTIYASIRHRSKIILQKREQRRKINELEIQMNQLKQKTLQLQMNPHVIFNTLNSIQQYIINNDIDNAVHYLSSFSKLMRRILNNSNERYIALSDELDAIHLYLELESMRLGNRFSYDIKIDDDIDDKNIEVAPLIIQPFVENAIIHGLVPKKTDCRLMLSFSKVAVNKILCVVEDNGVGRRYSERKKIEAGGAHKSYGMSITKRRLEMLGQLSNDDFSVEIIDLYDDRGDPAGTRVNITISFHE